MGGRTHLQINQKYKYVGLYAYVYKLSNGASARQEPKTKTETTTQIAGAVQNGIATTTAATSTSITEFVCFGPLLSLLLLLPLPLLFVCAKCIDRIRVLASSLAPKPAPHPIPPTPLRRRGCGFRT